MENIRKNMEDNFEMVLSLAAAFAALCYLIYTLLKPEKF